MKKEKFNEGDKVQISFTSTNLLHGNRKQRTTTIIVQGKIVRNLPNDPKDKRIRVVFDEPYDNYCPVCMAKVGGTLGFRCHPDDLKLLENSVVKYSLTTQTKVGKQQQRKTLKG